MLKRLLLYDQIGYGHQRLGHRSRNNKKRRVWGVGRVYKEKDLLADMAEPIGRPKRGIIKILRTPKQ